MDDARHFDSSRYRHWIDDHVRFSDLDPLGHVNNNSIGQYFENARADLFLKVTPQWPRRDQIFVLARVAIDFRRELHMPAQLRIGTGVRQIGRTSMGLASAVFRNADGIAYCETVSVLIDQGTRQPVEIPPDLRDLLAPYTIS